MTEKRFTSMYNGQSDMIQYVDTLKEEPNKWSICNVSETLQKLNELAEKNKQLKKQLDETIEGLHKEITTSENAFEGLIKENKELKQEQQELRILLTKIEREFLERGVLTGEEFMRLLE